MKRPYIILIVFLVIIGSIYIFNKEKRIGGERDKYGCLGPAGYTFDEDIKACIRTWELDMEEKRDAAKIAVEFVGEKKGLTVVEVGVARCPGCFAVSFNKYDKNFEINLENWEVQNLSPDGCTGRIVNIVDGSNCKENEVNIGKVVGFISPNICCL